VRVRGGMYDGDVGAVLLDDFGFIAAGKISTISRTASPAIDATILARAACHMGRDHAAWLYRR
jgi:hypothetical protein